MREMDTDESGACALLFFFCQGDDLRVEADGFLKQRLFGIEERVADGGGFAG
jgi:hypothetical protein